MLYTSEWFASTVTFKFHCLLASKIQSLCFCEYVQCMSNVLVCIIYEKNAEPLMSPKHYIANT